MAPTRQYPNHPDPMDLWLESQGYYRKSTARDGSCLFRAVAEQVYNTQIFHTDVRQKCMEYMSQNQDVTEGCDVEGSIESYLEHMKSATQWGGPAEIMAMSRVFKVDFMIFKTVGVPAEKVTLDGNQKIIMLCLSHDRHYDSVYLKEFTKIAGFCQAVVYEVLYKNVFGMKEVDYAVEKMLHDKPLRKRNEIGSCGHRHNSVFNYNCSSIQLQREGITIDSVFDDAEVNVRDLLNKGITPFPYKVAKSLDPNILRNVEFDVWIDYRRGLKHGYFGLNNELRVGVKCLVKMKENTYVAHIQEMAPDNGPVVLFVEELGEKQTVPYESLELLPKELIVKPQLSVTHRNERYSKSGMMTLQDSNRCTTTGHKTRKGKCDSTDLKENENHSTPVSMPSRHGSDGRRTRTKSVQSNVTDYDDDCVGGPLDSGMSPYQSYGVKNCGAGYQPYQQQCVAPSIVPMSPRPEDVPSYWLTSHNSSNSSERNSPTGGSNCSGSQKLCPTDFFHFVPYSPPDQSPSILETSEEDCEETKKDQSGISELDVNTDCLLSAPSSNEHINYNTPKSILDTGTDLPISDIPTLRFFFNLGVDVYQSQCSVYGWGTYTQPCSANCAPTCNSADLCGAVCITTVPTIHHVLEPTTPPGRQRHRQVALTSQGEGSPSNDPSHSVAPRFRKYSDGKGKCDLKAYEGQPLVHGEAASTHVLPRPVPPTATVAADNCETLQAEHSDHSTLTLAYPQTYGYVYYPSNYPSSPVMPYGPSLSAVESSDPHCSPCSPCTPCSVQFPEYSPGSPQSPQCYSNGDVYGTSPQFPLYTTTLGSPTPHYLYPAHLASPGIYVGSPPAWTQSTPSTSQ